MMPSAIERAIADRSTSLAVSQPERLLMSELWIGRRTLEVPCTVEVEQTSETLFAHVALNGFDVDEGDEVLVHDAPTHVAFGERIVQNSHATIRQASWFGRIWTRATAYLELTELYEVGFQPKE